MSTQLPLTHARLPGHVPLGQGRFWHEKLPIPSDWQTVLTMFVAPQWVSHEPHRASVFTVVSHPSPPTWPPSTLQSPKPALHWIPHVPLVQVAVPLAPEGQTWPHDPQFDGSVLRFTSQPFPALPSQSWKPLAQERTSHVPENAKQAVVATWGAAVQSLVHEPQECGELRLVSHPFARVPSQLANPDLQEPGMQRLAKHDGGLVFGGWAQQVPLHTTPEVQDGCCASPTGPSSSLWGSAEEQAAT